MCADNYHNPVFDARAESSAVSRILESALVQTLLGQFRQATFNRESTRR